MQHEIDKKSEFYDMFLEAKEVLLSYNHIVETHKERITTYSNDKGGICHMRTMKHGIDLGFLKGALMKDKYNILTGKGKKLRVVEVRVINKAWSQRSLCTNGWW